MEASINVASANEVGNSERSSQTVKSQKNISEASEQAKSSNFNSSASSSGDVTTSEPQISDQQAQEIGQIIAEQATVSYENNDTIVSFSDADVDSAYNEVLYGHSPFVTLAATKSGTTKIVWHGKAKNGNFDLYLSAKMLNRLKGGSISVGVTIVMAALALPLGPIGGVAWFTVNAVLKKIISLAINANVSHFKAGRIFHVKGWKYKSWSYQH